MAKSAILKGVRFKERAAQGELGIVRLPDNYSLPRGRLGRLARPIKTKGKLVVVIGHSETGHHHVMDPEKTTVYELPIESKILVVREEDTLTHLRDTATHRPLVFEPGKYMVTTLREFDSVNQTARLSRD